MADGDLSSIHVVYSSLAVGLVPRGVRCRLTRQIVGFLLVLPDKERYILRILVRWYHYIVACRGHVHRETAGTWPVVLLSMVCL